MRFSIRTMMLLVLLAAVLFGAFRVDAAAGILATFVVLLSWTLTIHRLSHLPAPVAPGLAHQAFKDSLVDSIHLVGMFLLLLGGILSIIAFLILIASFICSPSESLVGQSGFLRVTFAFLFAAPISFGAAVLLSRRFAKKRPWPPSRWVE